MQNAKLKRLRRLLNERGQMFEAFERGFNQAANIEHEVQQLNILADVEQQVDGLSRRYFRALDMK